MEALTSDARALTHFQTFATVIHNHSPDADVLDDQNGLAIQFKGACQSLLRQADLTENQRDALVLERNTWDLAHRLFSRRLVPSEDGPTPSQLVAANPFTPPSDLVGSLIASSSELEELALVNKWLVETAPDPLPIETNKNYWPMTQRREAHNLRRGGTKGEGLDPDATTRGMLLEGEDMSYDRDILRSLFSHLRSGNMTDGLRICESSSQSWRAASLRGGIAYACPPLSNSPHQERGAVPGGNRHRALWKRTCLRIARTSGLDPYERALYGSLAGDFKSVRPVCTTWEDVLWARVNARFERAVDRGLRESGGWWSSKGGLGMEKLAAEEAQDDDADLDAMFEYVAEKEEMRAASLDPYRVAQRHIILNTVPLLFQQLVNQLPTEEPEGAMADMARELYNQLLCFFAHFTLFLRFAGAQESRDSSAESEVLKAYCDVLEGEGELELVALYAGCIGADDSEPNEGGEDSYARFLTRMISRPKQERRQALFRTREHGLDLQKVALHAIEGTFSMHLYPFLDVNERDPVIARLDAEIKTTEMYLINSVEWLIFDKSTWDFALVRANGLLRWLLCEGRLPAVRELLQRLPDELGVSVGVVEAQDQQPEEIEYHKIFMECIMKLEASAVLEETRVARPELGSGEPMRVYNEKLKAYNDWFAAYEDSIWTARNSTLDLLTSNWLKLEFSSNWSESKRDVQLKRIRQIYVPDLVRRLHKMLVDSGKLQLALDLCNVVADQRYNLFTEYITAQGNALPVYLAAVRDVGLYALQGGGSDPFVNSAV